VNYLRRNKETTDEQAFLRTDELFLLDVTILLSHAILTTRRFKTYRFPQALPSTLYKHYKFLPTQIRATGLQQHSRICSVTSTMPGEQYKSQGHLHFMLPF
jgi:hypothetical protein